MAEAQAYPTRVEMARAVEAAAANVGQTVALMDQTGEAERLVGVLTRLIEGGRRSARHPQRESGHPPSRWRSRSVLWRAWHSCCKPAQTRTRRGRAGGTPLMQAAEAGEVDIVRLLLISGADSALADAQGRTALDLSADRPEIAVLLSAAQGAPDAYWSAVLQSGILVNIRPRGKRKSSKRSGRPLPQRRKNLL